jgi:Domain of unknown function (DUF4468) with TBP-like fold
MKKIILLIISIIPTFCINAQSLDAEKQYLESSDKSGKVFTNQVELNRKWNAFIAKYTYPELPVNNITGEIEISDILTFTSLDKKTIFQRCMQWIAIKNGFLIHNDFESGKIIANGLIDLTHYAAYPASFGIKEVKQIQTSTNYSIILTLKDNKIKYTITNISYNFTDFSETVSETSMPISSLFPIVAHDQMQWIRFITVLNASNDYFYTRLKKALVDYVADVENDYKF